MIVRAGTGRALAAPRPRSFAVPLPLQKKEVGERRSEIKRREMTQVHRPALSQYWWATHLRQLRPTLHQRGKKQITIDKLKNSAPPATASPADAHDPKSMFVGEVL
jgi:hypothetical protein